MLSKHAPRYLASMSCAGSVRLTTSLRTRRPSCTWWPALSGRGRRRAREACACDTLSWRRAPSWRTKSGGEVQLKRVLLRELFRGVRFPWTHAGAGCALALYALGTAPHARHATATTHVRLASQLGDLACRGVRPTGLLGKMTRHCTRPGVRHMDNCCCGCCHLRLASAQRVERSQYVRLAAGACHGDAR